jgi:saccharopine dehydrogenase (NAD+, L-lysine-forming)
MPSATLRSRGNDPHDGPAVGDQDHLAHDKRESGANLDASGSPVESDVKVAILGVGGLGRVVALELASDPRVQELVLVDKRGDRSKALKSIGHKATIRPLQGDVSNPTLLRTVLSGVDVAINASLPEFNLAIMAACLDVGVAYEDPWGLSPVAPGEPPGVLEQLRLDDAWKSCGIAAVVSMGSDPGISNIMARAASDRLEAVDEIRILKAASGGGAIEGYPLYSRAVFIRDALSRPTVWENGKIEPQQYVSGEEEYEFPAPVGKRRIYQFYHEEVLTIPHRLGRPVNRVCYKHDINPDLVRAIAALNALGLLTEKRYVTVGSNPVRFRDAFLAAFPEPSTLIGPVSGAMAIVSEAIGTKAGGGKVRVRGSIIVDHREANRKRGTTAERYVTAAALAAGAALLHEKKTSRPGVLVPEELPPEHLMPELQSRGITFQIEEFPA